MVERGVRTYVAAFQWSSSAADDLYCEVGTFLGVACMENRLQLLLMSHVVVSRLICRCSQVHDNN